MDISALTQAMMQTGLYTMPSSSIDVTDSSFLDKIRSGLSISKTDASAASQPVTLEERLKSRYPGIAYHVFDGSSHYWRGREDFPFHKIYQQDLNVEEVENWKPSGPNPSQLSSEVQRNLGSIPPGSKAVIIHPKVQQKMEENPAYAEEIFNRIEAWFTFDVARNEAILPGTTANMSQCVAIGEDGNIVNVQSCSNGSGITRSESNDTENNEDDFWTARAKRHHLYMQQVIQAQILHAMGISKDIRSWSISSKQEASATSSLNGVNFAALQSSQAAIAETMAMMNSEELRQALGDTIAGVSVDEVFASTKQAIADFHPALSSAIF